MGGRVQDREGIVQNWHIHWPVMRARRLCLGCGQHRNYAMHLENRALLAHRATKRVPGDRWTNHGNARRIRPAELAGMASGSWFDRKFTEDIVEKVGSDDAEA